jgi:hypothetical protein
MTLFAAVAPEEPIFKAALDKYFKGEHDPFTMNLLQRHQRKSASIGGSNPQPPAQGGSNFKIGNRKSEIDQKPSSPRLLPGFAALRLGVKFLHGADAGLSKRCPPKTEF